MPLVFLRNKIHEDTGIWTSNGCSETTFPQRYSSCHLHPSAPTTVSGCAGMPEPWPWQELVPALSWGSIEPSASGEMDKPGHLRWRFVGHRLLLLRNLAKPPKSKHFRHVFILPCTFPKGALCLEQLIISQALRFLTFKQRKHMFKQMFTMKPSFPIALLVMCDRNYSPAKLGWWLHGWAGTQVAARTMLGL